MNQMYRPDNRGMRQIANSGAMSDAMVKAAETGMRWAQAEAPRDSGEYASSFRVAPTTVRGGRQGEDRAGARIANDARHAIIVEQRTGVLARSVNIVESQR